MPGPKPDLVALHDASDPSNSKRISPPVFDGPFDLGGFGEFACQHGAYQLWQFVVGSKPERDYLSRS